MRRWMVSPRSTVSPQPTERRARLRQAVIAAPGLAPRTAIAALDLACAVAMVSTLWLGLTRPALAYVDPSVMTYTIQALAGVAVALSAVLGVVWRRARRRLLAALHVDENTGKVVEPPVHKIAPDDARRDKLLASASRAAAEERARQGRPVRPRLAFRPRLVLALLACAALFFGLLVVSPLEVVVGGSGSLSFTILNVWPPLAGAALVATIAVALALSALRGRAFDAALAVVLALSVATLAQRTLLNGGLPLADGSAVDWSQFAAPMATSTLVWIAIIAALVALALARPLAAHVTVVVAAFALVVAQGVSLGVMVADNLPALERPVVTEQGLMSVSPKKNVIVFVLDTLDTTYFDEAARQFPDSASEFGGFTYFRNSTAAMIPTRYGVPFLVTGNELDPDQAVFDTNEVRGWFNDHDLTATVQKQGYSAGVYSDSVNEGLSSLSGQTINVHELPAYTADPLACLRALGGCGLYRSLPWALKPAFWFSTDDLNGAVAPAGNQGAASTPYHLDDAAYYERLKSQGLTATDDGEAGAYRLIHLLGSHAPFVMDENGNATSEKLPEEHESVIRQTAGSLKIVEEYLRQLKELGVYNDATIIITADHGRWPWTDPGTSWDIEHIDRTTTPALLVKPAGADTSQPLTVSEAPTGHLDLPATIERAVGAEAQGPTVFDVPETSDRPRYFYWTYHDGKVDHAIYEWRIDGDALDFSNWEETGRSWPVDMEGYR